jgi:dTDP-L-rhamnose 4-epimerase
LATPVHPDGVVPTYLNPNAEFMRGDVRDAGTWQRALVDVDAVIHLAAYQDYLTDFSKFFHVNTVGTALLYETIVECHLPIQKIVLASSQATYGEGKYLCRQHPPPSQNGRASAAGTYFYPPLRPEAQLKAREWDVRCPECGGVRRRPGRVAPPRGCAPRARNGQ